MDQAAILQCKFGRLRVIAFISKVGYQWRVRYRCDCGTEKEVFLSNILKAKGATVSCGCWRNEQTSKARRSHGDSAKSYGTRCPEYRAWDAMKQRCLNPKDRAYKHYGGRGITIWPAWIDSYETFLADMGRKPSRKYWLERRDNELGYSPANCYWETPTNQCRNRRSSAFVEYNGVRKTIAEWNELLGPHIGDRIHRGWDVERAFTQPKRPRTVAIQ